MSLPHRRTTSAIALDELKRRNDLESLRKYLITENCFPATRDPQTALITLEELKKLVRIWKLNERRNFWKTHSERDEIVSALIQHAQQNMNFTVKKNVLTQKDQSNGNQTSLKPVPPQDIKPSAAQVNLKNYCGLKYFNRQVTSKELVMGGRFFKFPDTKDRVEHVVDQWRSEDFDMKDDLASTIGVHSVSFPGAQTGSINLTSGNSVKNPTVTGIKNKVKIVKQRNLAMHLMNYSAHADMKKTQFTMKTVQTFVTVAESDDQKTVSKCMIALSNISAEPSVRNILLEMNTMHKITNMLQYLRGKAAHWAAALLFYYFSCDKESEDRVYNACSVFLQVNGTSKDSQIRLVTLYTLNNLMPCIDRQRIAELIMRILVAQFEPNIVFQDKHLAQTYLTIMQNMSWFTNAHTTLLSINILDLLEKFARFAVNQRNGDMGLNVAKILQSFLQLPEHAANVVGIDFIVVLSVLFESDQELTLIQALKAAVVLSSVSTLRNLVHTTDLTRIIASMILNRGAITNPVAKEAAKFFCNITVPFQFSVAGNIEEKNISVWFERHLEDGVHDAVFAILKNNSVTLTSKSTAIKALQNIVSHAPNGFKLVTQTVEPMVKFLREQPDLGAAAVLYNLACIPLCRHELVESKVHLKVLDFMTAVKEPALKSSFLQILVQLSGSNVCIVELLKMDLISKLEAQIKFVSGKNDVWRDVSLMLLAVVAYTAHDLTEAHQISIVHILTQVCISGIDEDIIENCANVLKFISARYTKFHDIDPVVRSVLDYSDNEDIVESISTILYNMTCDFDNLPLMLKDSHYVNVMIRLMRNGKVHVQENIAYAIRTLCSVDKCTELLLKYDIISDLIVIALLRTSSEEIKIVCSQAFYNMLCHKKTRLELLKGDLWWALMRLGKTDSHAVRSMCIRALLDLSYPLDSSFWTQVKQSAEDMQTVQLHKSCIHALRTHHCLSFVKDLSLASNSENLYLCLQAAHNLLKQFSQFQDDAKLAANPFAVHEIIASMRIAADSLNRSSDIKSVRIAVILLLKCIQLNFNSPGGPSNVTVEANPLNAMVENELVNIDIVDTLNLSIPNWKFHSECRLNISRLLYELSKRRFFTKLIPLNDLNSILHHVYSSQNVKENSLELLENVVGVLFQFVASESVRPKEILQLTVWPLILKDALSSSSSLSLMNASNLSLLRGTPGGLINSPLLRQNSTSGGTDVSSNFGPPSVTAPLSSKARLSVYQREASIASMDSLDVLRGTVPPPFRIQGMCLMLLSFCIEEMLIVLQKFYQRHEGKMPASDQDKQDEQLTTYQEPAGEFTENASGLDDPSNAVQTKMKKVILRDHANDKMITESLLAINFHALSQGIIKNDFIDFMFTRNNLLYIIHVVTQFNTPVIESVFLPDTFQLLLRLLNTSVGSSRYEKMVEYCACFLRNIAVNHNYLQAFMQTPHFQVINELINELCDLSATRLPIAMDLSIFFYFLSDYLQTPGSNQEMKVLSPKFSLDMINKLLSHQMPSNIIGQHENAQSQNYVSQHYEMTNINKYTISIILNKYTFSSGVEPQFIQSMYSYLQTNSLMVIPNLMKEMSFKRLADVKYYLHSEYLQAKEMLPAELLLFYNESTNYFQPIVISSYQDNDHIVLKLTNSKSVVFERIENMEPLSVVVFQKIIVHFEPTTEQQYDLQNNMIFEENDEEDESSSVARGDQSKSSLPGENLGKTAQMNTIMELVNDLHEGEEEEDDEDDDEAEEETLFRGPVDADITSPITVVSQPKTSKSEQSLQNEENLDAVTSLKQLPNALSDSSQIVNKATDDESYSMTSFED
jgi:hypothetical protein